MGTGSFTESKQICICPLQTVESAMAFEACGIAVHLLSVFREAFSFCSI